MVAKNSTSKLYRSESNKVIAGVCGGLGTYFDIDPVILRVLFVFLTIFGGSGILLYFILWIIVPTKLSKTDYIKDNVEEIKLESQKIAKGKDSRFIFGVILIILGVSLLLENLGFYIPRHIYRLWPIILVILGISVIAKKH